MTGATRALGAVLAVGFAGGVAWLSSAPTTYATAEDATLRLSWRAPGVRLEECRRRTEEELERLAPHMRTPEVCSRRLADYELRVDLDGVGAIRDTVRAGGARGDRPLYVYRDLAVRPGRHALAVEFAALVPEGSVVGDGTNRYSFEDVVDVAAAEVALVTIDGEGSTLVRFRP